MVESKTIDHIKIKIKIQNPSKEPPVSSKAPNQDLNDIDVLWKVDVSKTIDHIQIKIKMPNPS